MGTMGQAINKAEVSGAGNINFDANQYKPDTAGYEAKANEIWSNYQQMGEGYLQNLRQQTSLKQQQLKSQLDMNKQKYQIENDRMKGDINSQYQQMNDDIAQQRYENLDYTNQMGANRGLSNSAQQMAMDNGVFREATKMFNMNSEQRNKSLNDLAYRLQSLNLDLDMSYQDNMTDLFLSQMDKEGQFKMAEAGKYMEHATNTLNTVTSMLEKHNDRLFATDLQKAQFEAQWKQQIAMLRVQDAQLAEAFERDMSKMATQHAYNKDMASFQHGLSMKMAEYQNALAMKRDNANRTQAFSEKQAKDMEEYEAMLINEYMEEGEMSFQEAQRKAQQATKIMFTTGRTLDENTKFGEEVFLNKNPLHPNSKSSYSSKNRTMQQSIFKTKDAQKNNTLSSYIRHLENGLMPEDRRPSNYITQGQAGLMPEDRVYTPNSNIYGGNY